MAEALLVLGGLAFAALVIAEVFAPADDLFPPDLFPDARAAGASTKGDES